MGSPNKFPIIKIIPFRKGNSKTFRNFTQLKATMSLFSIFVTEKKEDKFTPAGQTNNASPANMSAITKKVTGEQPTGMKIGASASTTTENFHVDFVKKDECLDILVNKQ
jgi:hypothetical protein